MEELDEEEALPVLSLTWAGITAETNTAYYIIYINTQNKYKRWKQYTEETTHLVNLLIT